MHGYEIGLRFADCEGACHVRLIIVKDNTKINCDEFTVFKAACSRPTMWQSATWAASDNWIESHGRCARL